MRGNIMAAVRHGPISRLLAAVSLASLAACGGSSGDGTPPPVTVTPTPVPTPTPTPTPVPDPPLPITAGIGNFMFSNWAGPPIRVYYYRPVTVNADTRILFVFHGNGRNASSYNQVWAPHATTGNYIVITPEFTEQAFPSSRTYHHGHVFDSQGNIRPREQWTFSVVEPLFDAVRHATGTQVQDYGLYGHSAGAQFLHRFLMLMPDARYSRVIAANSGWYTLPDLTRTYPGGLDGTPVDQQALGAALQKPMIILLGTADTDPNDPDLPKTPEAMEQGPHRFARGHYFFDRAQTAAAQRGVPLAWRIEYAPGIAHSNSGMSRTAKDLIWD